MPFRLKVLLIIAVVSFVFVFPKKAYAGDFLEMHFINVDDEGNEYWMKSKLVFEGSFSGDEKYTILFKNLLEDDRVNFIPSDVTVIGVFTAQDILAINVSKEIKGYSGGYMESRIAGQIIKTALSIPGVNKVSLYIESVLSSLPEGIIIDETVEWHDVIV